MKKLLILLTGFIVLFLSCRKDNITPSTIDYTPAMGRDTLFSIMKDWYYWNNMPEPSSVTLSNKSNYKDPYELLEAMRYKALDRWSFVADYDQYTAEYQGDFVGHGIRIGLASDGSARIAAIYNKSPLYASGVRRGWIVEKVNNVDVAAFLLANGPYVMNELFGEGKEGITNIFLFKTPSGTDTTISSTKTAFKVNTVLVRDTLQLSTGITGHLVLDSFIEPTVDELTTAFAKFKTYGVKDLILDLRYNQGGLLFIATVLGSFIVGNEIEGSVFIRLQYNNRHIQDETILPFLYTIFPLSIPRIIVITTRSTASASEAFINGLKPFVNVVIIGDTTDGKPVGMNMWNVGSKYIMVPITFKTVNANNEGDYYEGFPPSKVAPDDITHDFSDREESCLKEAIYYLENGFVSTKGLQEFKRFPTYSEKPEWMNNAFVFGRPAK
jgi:carboxyl-terminal processing protease